MEPIEQELSEIRADIEDQNKKIKQIYETAKDTYDAVVGTKLLPSTGVIYRMQVMENNISTITQSVNRLEKTFNDQIAADKVIMAGRTVKLNILWAMAGAGCLAVVGFLFNEILKVISKHPI